MTRPTTTRKVTRKTAESRAAELDKGVSITVDGEVYTVRQGDLSALDTAALRAETGYSLIGLQRALATDPDLDLVAAFVWLARRLSGEKSLTYVDVASELGYDVEVDIDDAKAPTKQETDDPEG